MGVHGFGSNLINVFVMSYGRPGESHNLLSCFFFFFPLGMFGQIISIVSLGLYPVIIIIYEATVRIVLSSVPLVFTH